MSEEILLFDSFKNRYLVRGDLRLLTPLHVGIGIVYQPIGSDAPLAKDILGRPFILGSSLKGSFRSHIERIVRALGSKRLWSCDIFEKDGLCVEQRIEKEKLKESPPEEIYKNSCSICRLFGSPYLASKVYINDLKVKEETWVGHIEIRDGVGLDRDTGTAREKVKFDLEVVPPGMAFEFELLAENATEEDLELLALGLREMMEGNVRLGGSKSRGLGYCKLEGLSIEYIDKREDILEYLISRKMKSLDPTKFIEEKIKNLVERIRKDVEEDSK